MVLHLMLILTLIPADVTQGRPSDKTPRRRESVLAAKTYQSQSGHTLPYRLFVPRAYDQRKKYPLVLYLHGGGGLGRDNLKQIQGGNSFITGWLVSPANQAKYPCFVVIPQSHDEGWVESDTTTPSAQLRLVSELIEHLQKTYSIERERLYVVGQSLGGFGTFALISLRPDLFAAAVPVCGGGDESKAPQIARVPLWAFHGDRDEAVNVERSRRMIAALRKAGGKPKYTEYGGAGHAVWQKVVHEPGLLPWVFGHRLSR